MMQETLSQYPRKLISSEPSSTERLHLQVKMKSSFLKPVRYLLFIFFIFHVSTFTLLTSIKLMKVDSPLMGKMVHSSIWL